MREITKIGLAAYQGDRLLLVRKKGSSTFILPGGKPEAGEDDAAALHREIREELGCSLAAGSSAYMGLFSDWAADEVNVRVHVRLYAGALVGKPVPLSEIAELLWLDPADTGTHILARSLTNLILPFLIGAARDRPCEARQWTQAPDGVEMHRLEAGCIAASGGWLAH